MSTSNLRKVIRIARQNSVITPRLTGWLAQHGEGVVVNDPETAELLLRLVSMGKSRAYAFHPSQLYQCERRQVFDYHDVEGLREYNAQLQNIFNDGTWRHTRWQIMLMNAGILDRVEVAVAMPTLRLEGSMDGVNDTDSWMFELKGTSQSKRVRDYGVMPAHVQQIHAYLLAADLPKCVVVYEDKSTQDWIELEVHRDEATITEIKEILGRLNEAIDHDQLPEVQHECKAGSGTAFNDCPYSHVCLQAKTAQDAIELSSVL